MERTFVELFDCSIRLDRLTGSSPVVQVATPVIKKKKLLSKEVVAASIKPMNEDFLRTGLPMGFLPTSEVIPPPN
jgi:hypothetical protein